MDNVIEVCLQKEGQYVTDRELLQCAINEVKASTHNEMEQFIADLNTGTRSMLLIYAASCVFFMQAGFAMVCAGAVRKKNLKNTMLKNLLDACGSAIAFFTIGYAIAFGGSDPTSARKTFTGTANFFLMDVTDLAFWTFQYAFSAASATIVAGALSERCQMAAYLGYSVVLSGFVYPIVAHAIWDAQGFFSAANIEPFLGVGMIDVSGSAVVHITGGLTALVALLIMGPRRGRFHDDKGRLLENPQPIKGYSASLQMLGTFILWFGWYSFNCGSAILGQLNSNTASNAALAATNTTLAAGVGGMSALMFQLWWLWRTTGEAYFDIQAAMNGCLAGLVSVTAGCAVIEPWASVVVGFIAGIMFIVTSHLLVRLRIDDAVDAVPVHLVSGIWGILSVGLLSSPSRQHAVYGRSDHPGLFYSWKSGSSDGTLLATQFLGIIFICGWILITMLPFFVWLNWIGKLRIDAIDELIGLDGGDVHSDNDEKNQVIHFEAIQRIKQSKTPKKCARTISSEPTQEHLNL